MMFDTFVLVFTGSFMSMVDKHCCQYAIKFVVGIKQNQDKLPTLYWLH